MLLSRRCQYCPDESSLARQHRSSCCANSIWYIKLFATYCATLKALYAIEIAAVEYHRWLVAKLALAMTRSTAITCLVLVTCLISVSADPKATGQPAKPTKTRPASSTVNSTASTLSSSNQRQHAAKQAEKPSDSTISCDLNAWPTPAEQNLLAHCVNLHHQIILRSVLLQANQFLLTAS